MLQLGGVDVITFSGGIGENSAEIRAAVLRDLGGFGIELDEARTRGSRAKARFPRSAHR